MKKIQIIAVLCSLFFSSLQAQPSLDMGKVVLHIQPEYGGDPEVKPGDYIFTMDNGTPIGFTEHADGNYTEIAFTGTFERNNQTIEITCSIQISPSGEGTFIFPKKAGDNPPKNANIEINLSNSVVMGVGRKGTAGSVVVSHYPEHVGDFLTGTFSGTLGDSFNSEIIKNLYKVTGSFKIKKTE